MGIFLTWNAGGRTGKDRADDVAYIRAALDDLGSVVKVDPKRVYRHGNVQRRDDVLPSRR